MAEKSQDFTDFGSRIDGMHFRFSSSRFLSEKKNFDRNLCVLWFSDWLMDCLKRSDQLWINHAALLFLLQNLCDKLMFTSLIYNNTKHEICHHMEIMKSVS